ncbi:MAG TPA: hypothetical protein VNG31_01335 [Candidatus Baltobacteraceae bacterium]|nr:hypothetical protein [Candidatus Baltobacteraceae bacterium]
MWFTGDSGVGRITTAGETSLFNPTDPVYGYYWFEGADLAAAPDGSLWLTGPSVASDPGAVWNLH